MLRTNFKTPLGFGQLRRLGGCVVGKKGTGPSPSRGRQAHSATRLPSVFTSERFYKLLPRPRFKTNSEMSAPQFRPAMIRIRVLLYVTGIVVVLGGSLFVARHVRRRVLSRRDLAAGQAAYEAGEWSTAYEHFKEFLGRNPDNVEIWKKYAQARLSIQPLEPAAIYGAIPAYRRVMQLDPLDGVAYDKLVKLYTATRNFTELAHIARTRMDRCPDDMKAPLWLADAQIFLDKKEEAKPDLEAYIAKIEALPDADKHEEYVQAYLKMSQISDVNEALELLDEAIAYAPRSADPLVRRIQLYWDMDADTAKIPGIDNNQEKLEAIRQDLEAADKLGTNKPQLRLFLADKWLFMGEFDRAKAELIAIEDFDQETLDEHYLDPSDVLVAKYSLEAELALQRGAPIEAARLADEAITKHTQERHRRRILPSAIAAYIEAERVSDANSLLGEYAEVMPVSAGTAQDRWIFARAQAQVAQAQKKPYAVIDILEPLLLEPLRENQTAAQSQTLSRLLITAYNQTRQTPKAARTLATYLGSNPQDMEMTLRLAQAHLKMGNWSQAFEAANRVERLVPLKISAKLPRIEAAIHLAASDTAALKSLATELAQLRQSLPTMATVRMLQAQIAVYLELPEQAEQMLKLALDECDESLGLRLKLAQFYLSIGRADTAIEVCIAACDRHPTSPGAWLLRARIQEVRKDYGAAQDALKEGLTSVRDRTQKRSLSLTLAILERMHGKHDDGIMRLRELAAQEGRDVQVLVHLLSIEEVRDNQEETAKLLDDLRLAEGENGLNWNYYQAMVRMESADWYTRREEIVKRLKRCLDANPQWLPPAILMLEMYEKLRDFKSYEETCRRVLLRNPEASDVANLLSNLLEQQGRFEEAQTILQQTAITASDQTDWQVRLALRSGDISQAIQELELKSSNDDQDANSRISLALLYHQAGDVTRAFVLLKEAATLAPDSRRLITARVRILKTEGRAEEALKTLDDYVVRQDTFEAYQLRAAYLAGEHEVARAEQDYKKLTTFAEQGATGALLLCNFYVAHKKLDAAVEQLEQAIVTYPDDRRLKRMLMQTLILRDIGQDQQDALVLLAALEEDEPDDPRLMMLRVNQLLSGPTPSVDAAKAKLEEIIALVPTAVAAHLELVRITVLKGVEDGEQIQAYETARSQLMRALGSVPNNLDLMSARSQVELALDNATRAKEIALQVLEKDPNQITALSVLLTIAREAQDTERLQEIRKSLGESIENNPDDESLRLIHARALSALQLPQIAIDELEAYCQTEPGSHGAMTIVRLARLYRQVGDMDKAQQALNEAERMDPNLPALTEERTNWATTLSQIGKPDQAETLLRTLMAEHPANTVVMNNLAWLLQDHFQRYDEALKIINKALGLTPGDLYLLDTRGTILQEMPDRLADAKRDFTKLLKQSPPGTRRQINSLLQLGRVCAKLNELAQAKQHLRQALTVNEKIDKLTPEERSEITRIMER